jgi:hypothetical protein
MRKRTVQSVLARRHMFKNGGMVPPQAQPAGILASSPSLVDAVSNDALSDMGGGTLSMAQGGAAVNMQPSYVFNQGGIAKFRIDGVPSYLAGLKEVGKVLNGTANLKELQIASNSVFAKDPRVQAAIQSFNQDQTKRTVDSKPGEDIVKVKTDPIELKINNIPDPVKPITYNSDDGFGEYPVARNPDDGFGEYPVARNPDDGFGQFPTEGTIQSFGLDPKAGEKNLTLSRDEAAAQLRAENPQSIFDPEETIDGVPLPIDKSEVIIDQEGNKATVGDIKTNTVAGVADGDLSLEDGIEAPDPSPQSVVPGTTVTEVGDGFGEPETKIGDAGLGETTKISSEDRTQANEIAKIFEEKKVDETGRERPKTKEEFIQDFKESMPKYKGMSEEEKGFTIMEAGLRVMAGKSPDGIQNIAEGLKGVSKEFVKDKKAKRAFEQQVDLSAAKYALTGLETLRKEELALAKEGRQRKFELIATKDYTNDEGVLIKKGDVVLPTNKQLSEGFLEGKPLTFKSTFLSDAKALAKIAEANKPKRTKASAASGDREKYTGFLDSYKSSLAMKSVLRESARLAASGNVIGLSGYFQNALDSALNAIGVQEGKENRLKFLADYRSTDKKDYDSNQKRLGVAMATELLREGSKTLSDFDRKRVEELIADMVGTDGIFVSEKVLRSKLENLERVIDGNITKTASSLEAIEGQWNREVTEGGTNLGKVFKKLRRSTLQGLSSYRPGIGGAQAITYDLSKIYDFKAKKFLPSFITPRGK